MRVSEIMTPDPEVVTVHDTVSRAAAIMRDRDVGSVPVVDDGDRRQLRGIITDRDIAVRHVAEGHRDDCTVAAHMTRDPVETVRPDDDIDTLAEAMKRRGIRRVPVVDAEGRLVGIVAQADLAVELGSSEPETVAEVIEKISEPGRPVR
ncbi:MAG TPA: CBS domain-containing protein [Vicinamibacterales bacterium]|nr:CBS domain-containing protein [Vicinamibacterales bacterium]